MNKHIDGTFYIKACHKPNCDRHETRCTCGHEKDSHEESFGYITGCWNCSCEEFRAREKSSKRYKTKEHRITHIGIKYRMAETIETAIAKGYVMRCYK